MTTADVMEVPDATDFDSTAAGGADANGAVAGEPGIATSRSTDISSFGNSATITTDNEASVANARPGPNQLAPSHERQPVAGRSAAPRASVRIRASAAAEGCTLPMMCSR